MNDIWAALLGLGICCVVPLGMFTLGVWYARHGLPFEVRWKGANNDDD